MKALKHFLTIARHRREVRRLCFEVGLYWQGLTHDLSKYSWAEFSVGAKYFMGTRSPNDAERFDKGISYAWLHHKGRNKHHFEYWIDYSMELDGRMAGQEMPVKYVVEMFCDRVAACKIYQGDKYTEDSALLYYNRGKGRYMMHEKTAALIEDMLEYLAKNGEKATCAYIRKEILHNKR